MRRSFLTLGAFITLLVGCQGFQKTQSHQAVGRSKAKLAKRFPKVKEVDAPARIFDHQGDLSKTVTQDATQLQGPVALTDKEKIFFELAGEKADQLSELEIYHKVAEKYQQNDEVAVQAYANLLIKKYPRSIYCDNALYFQGMMAFTSKKFGESLNAFQRILQNYPQSNKAVSALFAKGVVFKKMNLPKEAARVLASVINKYPGSPESDRAEIELKLINQ